MSTSGVYGMFYEGILKSTYNHFDSSIDSLGREMIMTIMKYDIEYLKHTFNYIRLCDENYRLSRDEKKICVNNKLWRNVDDGKNIYAYLRESQGSFDMYINRILPYMIDGNGLYLDLTRDEMGYIIDLDREALHVYSADASITSKCEYRGSVSFNNIKKHMDNVEFLIDVLKVTVMRPTNHVLTTEFLKGDILPKEG